MQNAYAVTGRGLGLRRAFLFKFLESIDKGELSAPDFIEVAPENWIGIGGAKKRAFDEICERIPLVCHGLSLSIGSPDPLDESLVHSIKAFNQQYNVKKYTEHLSYASAAGHLYDLMPIPFSATAVAYVSERILRVQDILGERIALENVSYYAAPHAEMSELDFICAVLEKADCELLLDVNNIWVNSINHNYDPHQFLKAMPSERVSYVHVAGHYDEADDLKVDTHGSDVCSEVWGLLAEAYDHFGLMPTLLERDFNIPNLAALNDELIKIEQVQQDAQRKSERNAV